MNQNPIDSSGASRASLQSYVTGFVLSIVLTMIAFGLVISGTFSRGVIVTSILGAGIAQILVHLHYFLHLNSRSSARWNLLALLFTVLIMALFVGGTLWIMHHLKYRLL